MSNEKARLCGEHWNCLHLTNSAGFVSFAVKFLSCVISLFTFFLSYTRLHSRSLHRTSSIVKMLIHIVVNIAAKIIITIKKQSIRIELIRFLFVFSYVLTFRPLLPLPLTLPNTELRNCRMHQINKGKHAFRYSNDIIFDSEWVRKDAFFVVFAKTNECKWKQCNDWRDAVWVYCSKYNAVDWQT